VATVILAIAAIIGGTAGLGDWRSKQRAQRELAAEEAKAIRLNRQRYLHGWSPGNAESFGVRLVTDPAELSQAVGAMLSGELTDYVLLRVTSGGNGGQRLRDRVAAEGFIARVPSDGEYEALEAGLGSMGIRSSRRVTQRATVGD
jgi:hypothetical protein